MAGRVSESFCALFSPLSVWTGHAWARLQEGGSDPEDDIMKTPGITVRRGRAAGWGSRHRQGRLIWRALLLNSAYTGVWRFSSLGEGGMRSSSLVRLLEWLGLWDASSGAWALCRGGRVEHRAWALERGCWGGGPFSTHSSLVALGCVADWEGAGCEDDGETDVCGGGDGRELVDDEDSRGTKGARVRVCWNLLRLLEWLGRGRL